MEVHPVFWTCFAIFLVACNGFFVLSEFAIVKIRRTRLEELTRRGNKTAKLALNITSKLDSYLSATQLGITLASLGLGWVGEPAVARLITPLFEFFIQDNPILLHSVAFVIAFSFITLFHVVAGELIPKSIAIAKVENVVLFVARPLHAFWIICFPIIRTFDFLAVFALHRMGIKPASEGEESAHSGEELKIIVGESLRGGFLDSVENEIIQNAVSFSDTTAKEVMTPRKDMICLFDDNSYDENIRTVISTKHTRYPYCKDGSKDEIIGMVHLRDLLETTLSNHPEKQMRNLVREMIIVPESASISNVLLQMNKRQIHAALVVDEYGGTAGLLTVEDILEEVIGEINDEHDKKVEDYHRLGDGEYELDGMLDIERTADVLGVEFKDTEQITIGGYVFNLLERAPSVGDIIADEVCDYEVLEIDGARIVRLKAKRKK